ncbi:unnamed protein product, partial [Pocillopora meandrina]
MNKALGVSELSHSEHLYLEALAEVYQNATSWDTHRQVLSIMAGVHVTSPSNVADHCVLFALSDSSDADYQQQCSHQHIDLCDRCQSLQETLAKIERVLGETTFPTQDAKDEALFIFQTAQLAIMSWKCHILR